MTRGVAAFVLLLVISACGRNDDDTVFVMAAASLTEAFAEIESSFEAANPEVDVQLNLAGSASLREQILQGAPADVFASANELTMQAVAEAGGVEASYTFATNELRLAVPVGNPADVASLNDLADEGLLVGLCAAGVPCGDFARQALDRAGVVASVDTNERDVRSLVTRLAADELDVGIVYATDVRASAEIEAVDVLVETGETITYPIAQLRDAPNATGAQAFVDFVRSPEGQAILLSHGFASP